MKRILGNWAIDTVIRAQSAYPFTPRGRTAFLPDSTMVFGRPNLAPGVPLYLDDLNVPGERRVNRAAFQLLPTGQVGNAGRDIVRGFPSWNVDLALRRTLSLQERIKLVFRAEAFNLFNHPNFGLPESDLTNPFFGQSTTMLSRTLGGLSPIYQTGGPRSMQLALRLEF